MKVKVTLVHVAVPFNEKLGSWHDAAVIQDSSNQTIVPSRLPIDTNMNVHKLREGRSLDSNIVT